MVLICFGVRNNKKDVSKVQDWKKVCIFAGNMMYVII